MIWMILVVPFLVFGIYIIAIIIGLFDIIIK